MLVTAVSVLHGCILWVSILIPALAPQSGSRWCPCRRAEALSCSCLLAARPQGHCAPRAHHRGQKANSCKKRHMYLEPCLLWGPHFCREGAAGRQVFSPGLDSVLCFLVKTTMNYEHVPSHQVLTLLPSNWEQRGCAALSGSTGRPAVHWAIMA